MSPEGQLNFRIVAGGWLNGDELPLQRRFSVGGPGSIDGYPFRRTSSGDDVRQCSDGVNIPLGMPAQCERMVLLQAEYRGDLWMSMFGDWQFTDSWRHGGWRHRAQWVVFTDAGRGWLVGNRVGDLQYPTDQLPKALDVQDGHRSRFRRRPDRPVRGEVGVGLEGATKLLRSCREALLASCAR